MKITKPKAQLPPTSLVKDSKVFNRMVDSAMPSQPMAHLHLTGKMGTGSDEYSELK